MPERALRLLYIDSQSSLEELLSVVEAVSIHPSKSSNVCYENVQSGAQACSRHHEW